MALKFVTSKILCCKNVYECVSFCSIDKKTPHLTVIFLVLSICFSNNAAMEKWKSIFILLI